jgi:hypothetical protein
LQRQICFFLAELVCAVTYFVGAKNFSNSKFLKPVLPVTSRFVIANHFRRHAILKLLGIELISELALSIPVYFYLNFFQAFFQDWLSYMREVLNNIRKIYHLIFLQEPYDVRLGS